MRRVKAVSWDSSGMSRYEIEGALAVPSRHVTCMSVRDYRLMLAVVRAAEKMHNRVHSKHEWPCSLCIALDAFNAGGEKR